MEVPNHYNGWMEANWLFAWGVAWQARLYAKPQSKLRPPECTTIPRPQHIPGKIPLYWQCWKCLGAIINCSPTWIQSFKSMKLANSHFSKTLSYDQCGLCDPWYLGLDSAHFHEETSNSLFHEPLFSRFENLIISLILFNISHKFKSVETHWEFQEFTPWFHNFMTGRELTIFIRKRLQVHQRSSSCYRWVELAYTVKKLGIHAMKPANSRPRKFKNSHFDRKTRNDHLRLPGCCICLVLLLTR